MNKKQELINELRDKEVNRNVEQQGKQLTFANGNPYPDNFYIEQAIADGSCFFDSFRQGLEQQKGIKVTVEQLRKDCQEFAQMNLPKWFALAIFNKPNQHGQPMCHDVDSYIASILNDNEWGDPEVEGRILCDKYKVKLHLIEKQSCYMDLLIKAAIEVSRDLPSGTNNLSEEILLEITNSYNGKESDSQKALIKKLNEIISQRSSPKLSQEASELLNRMEEFSNINSIHVLISSSGGLLLDNLDYNDQNTIHIINNGMSHFEPLLDRNRDLIQRLQEEQIQEQNDHLVARELQEQEQKDHLAARKLQEQEQNDHLVARELQEQEQKDHLAARELQEKEDYLLAKKLQVDEILEHCGREKDDPRREEVQNILDELLVTNPNKGIVDVIKQCIDFVKQHIFKPKSFMEEPNSTSNTPNQSL